MDIEVRLRQLEARHRRASSATNAAKAHYLALNAEVSTTADALAVAKSNWQKLDAHKRAIAARMGEVEDLV